MYLENVVFDAVEPQRLGRFWEAALGCERLTDEPEGFETRLGIDGGPDLDLCFQRVPAPPPDEHRLILDLGASTDRDDQVDRLLALGARRTAGDDRDGPWTVLGDPEGNLVRVRGDGPVAGTGPLATLALASADPDRDAAFWSWLTGWVPVADGGLGGLRHPSSTGPVLELRPERSPKGAAKNRVHLDLRLEADDDPDVVAAGILERGGQELHPDWGDLPWRFYADPSGNEFCVLPARS